MKGLLIAVIAFSFVACSKSAPAPAPEAAQPTATPWPVDPNKVAQPVPVPAGPGQIVAGPVEQGVWFIGGPVAKPCNEAPKNPCWKGQAYSGQKAGDSEGGCYEYSCK